MSSAPDQASLLQAIPRLADRRILVVGDLFLDEYWIGRAARLSREAPIPVLEFEEKRFLPGGGANPAMNVVALGGRATQVGVVGDDEAGHRLTDLLERAGIDTSGLVLDPSRPTATKTRVVAQGSLRFPQQLVRLDRLDRRPVSGSVQAQVVTRLAQLAPQAGAVLVSDYRSGLVTPSVVEAVRESKPEGGLITVDSQGRLAQFGGFDLVKCNHHEANAYLSHRGQDQAPPMASEGDYQKATQRLRQKLGLGASLITRGAQGLSLRDEAGYLHLPAANRSQVFDVTGAGDTVIAVTSLALAASYDLRLAARLANYAAGLVVRKLGVATASPQELAWAIQNW
jgi:rfaE bifunctional protein kinase chain/domain